MSQNDRGNQGRSEEDADDVRLMQLVGRGNTQAFEQLIEKHQTLVAGTVARMLGSTSDVEDIAQQVFIRVWKSARRYVPRAKFTTWLLKITRNLVFNEMRRTKRRPHIPLQSEPGTEDPPLKDETTLAPDASLLESELQQAIEEAIQRLPETQRFALGLSSAPGLANISINLTAVPRLQGLDLGRGASRCDGSTHARVRRSHGKMRS